MTPAPKPGKPARVLQVVQRFWPEMGGIETHVYEVARRLDPADFDVSILTTDRTGALPKRESLEGISVERVKSYPKDRDFYLSPKLFWRILTRRYDLVHFQGVHTFVPILGMLAATLSRQPYILTFHTGGHSSAARAASRSTQWRVLRPLLAHARLLIGVSRFETEYFTETLRLPASRFRTIRNGGALPPADLGPDAGNPETGPLFLSIGRLEAYKGHHRLIAALPAVRKEHPGARVSILGAGPYEQGLLDLAAELGVSDAVTVDFIPGADRLTMARKITAADVVVMLSEYEAHPVAVMEALALDRPVLVARTSGLTELADEGFCSSVELDADPEVVAEALATILRGDAPRTATIELPTWETCLTQLAEAYRQALAA